jgi:hypothetical protein
MGGEPTAKRKAQKGLTMNTNEMTMRKYHEAVLAIPGCPADVAEKAKAEIAKLDATNAKRTEKAKEKSAENKPVKDAIYQFLLNNGTKTSPEIADGVGITTSKASAMCRQMVDEGQLTVSEVKVPKKGKLKAYTAILHDEQGEDDAVQVTDIELNSMF